MCLVIINEPLHEKKKHFQFPTRSDTSRYVLSQQQASSLKFWVKIEEILYYRSSENKGADQLCSDCTADLHLCFPLCILLVFSCSGSFFFPLCDSVAV